MALRNSMQALISRVRLLINDPAGTNAQFADSDIQDVLDESRIDYVNEPLKPVPTYSGSTIQYLDYFHDIGGWEDDVVLKQFLTTVVTPSESEPIVGHWTFALSTFPPVYITGSVHDVYRAAADLLERWSARYATRFDFTSDGQSFRVSQAHVQLLDLAHTYRMKQRPGTLKFTRGDMNTSGEQTNVSLGPTPIDYMSSG